MARRRFTLVLALGALIAPPAGGAQEVTFSGQVRPRFEYRDPVSGGKDDVTSMRVRFAADVQVETGLSVFIQAQDVRLWGGESHPLFDFSADALDLHQGYLRFRGERTNWLTTTIGRMETSLGGQRLVGAVDWAQQGQSFDGIRFDADAGRTRWAFLGFTVRDDTAGGNREEDLFGAYGTIDDLGPGALDVYWLYDRVSGTVTGNEHIYGARYAFEGSIRGRVEATLESGTRADTEVSAFMVGGRLGTTVAQGRLDATLWYDYLSGDDPTTPEVEVFSTLYATNHKFYGFADLFLNIPSHTAGAGLQDIALKLAYRASDRLSAGLDAHSFRAAEQGTLTATHFGDEVDLTLTHRTSDALTTTLGFSNVWQGAGLSEIGRLSDDLHWFYVMVNAAF